MIVIISLTIFGSIFVYYATKYTWRSYILWNAIDRESPYGNLPVPPGDFGLPIIGETHLWAVQGSQFNSIRRKKYGKVFSTNFIGRTMVKVTGPEHVKKILTAHHDTVATIWPTTVQKILGKTAIANSVGSMHKLRRRAFLKAFTRDALNNYIPLIQDSVRETMQSWWIDSDKTHLMYTETKKLTFNIAFRVLVGLTSKNNEERLKLFDTFDSMIKNLLSLPYDFPGSGFRKALQAKKIIHEILDDHLRKVRKDIEESALSEYVEKDCSQHNNLLKIVLEAQVKPKDSRVESLENAPFKGEERSEEVHDEEETLEMSDAELKETTVEMLFAGYQTMASISTSALINIIKHPEVFYKLAEEMRHFGFLKKQTSYCDVNSIRQDDVTASNPSLQMANGDRDGPCIRHRKNDSDTLNNNNNNSKSSKLHFGQNQVNKTALTMEMLSKLTYLEQFFKETLRVGPPILGGYRLALKTFQIGEFRVPKGWTIIYNIRDTHESEWEEDMKFNPDRFSPDNWKDTKESRYRWVPFGGGPRTCVGKEFARLQFKIFIIELIKHFSRIEFAKGKPPKMFAVPFLHPTDGLPVKLTRRTTDDVTTEP